MNKKAIFIPIWVVVSILLITYVSYLFLSKDIIDRKEYIGKNSLELINTYNEGEKFLIYTEQAARLSIIQALEELASNGGVLDDKNCEKINDFVVWSFTIPKCLPKDNLLEDFKNLFSKNLNSYLKNYKATDENIKINFVEDNYILTIVPAGDKITIMGSTKQDLIFEKKTDKLEIKYKVKPDFKIETLSNIAKYQELKASIEKCANDLECLKNSGGKLENNNLIKFEIPTINDFYTNKLITIKFIIKTIPIA